MVMVYEDELSREHGSNYVEKALMDIPPAIRSLYSKDNLEEAKQYFSPAKDDVSPLQYEQEIREKLADKLYIYDKDVQDRIISEVANGHEDSEFSVYRVVYNHLDKYIESHLADDIVETRLRNLEPGYGLPHCYGLCMAHMV